MESEAIRKFAEAEETRTASNKKEKKVTSDGTVYEVQENGSWKRLGKLDKAQMARLRADGAIV